MTILDHTHGVVHFSCDHDDCIAARRRYLKRWRYDRAHGLLRLTDPSAVRLHIATLRGYGWSLRAIAGESSTSPTTISRYVNSGQVKVSKAVAARVLAIDPSQIPSTPSRQTTEPFVPRIGTVRRIHALMAIGYSHSDLKQLGIDSANLIHQQGLWVTRTTHDHVAGHYRDLSRREGPTPRAARDAAKRGHLGPTAWDDIDRDPAPELDETPEPETAADEVAILRRANGDRTIALSTEERHELVRRLHRRGLSDPQIALEAGYSARQILRDRQALGLPANDQPDANPVSSEHFTSRGRARRERAAS